MNDSVYCALPWMQLMISPSGDYKVCCFSGDHTINSHGYCLDDNDKPMNVLTHTMQEALNSKTCTSIRNAQLKNGRHPECAVCWARDDNTVLSKAKTTSSFRVMRTFHDFPNWGIETSSDVVTKNELKVRSLDLRFTNTCNLKCIMCGPLYSTLWYEDYTRIYGNKFGDAFVRYNILKDKNGVYSSDMPMWYDTDIWKERFNSVKHDLRHLYITGGEPFIVKGHLDMLDDLIECDLAKNIVIDVDTNLTVINHKILEKFSKFKKIVLSISVDDIRDRYNYIRFPGNFDVFVKNLNFLMNNKSDNVIVKAVSCCVGTLNIFAPMRFAEFMQKQNIPSVRTAYRILRHPQHFDIMYLPKHIKDNVLKHFEDSGVADAKESLVPGHLTRNYDIPDHECYDKIKKHVAYLDKLDSLRGTNWRQTFPDTYDLLKNARIE